MSGTGAMSSAQVYPPQGSSVVVRQGSTVVEVASRGPQGPPGSLAASSGGTIDANSATPALRITQLGAGAALLVEDSASTDATPFEIKADGTVGVGRNAGAGSRLALQVPTISEIGMLLEVLQGAAGTGEWTALSLNGNDTASSEISIQWQWDSINPPNAPKISAYKDSGTAAHLRFYTVTGDVIGERMRIDAAGLVGVGTTSPAYKLDTYDASSATVAVRGDATTFFMARRTSTDSTAPMLYFSKGRGTAASPAIVANNDELGEIRWLAHNGTSFADAALLRVAIDGTPGAGDIPTRMQFYTIADGSGSLSERMRITNAGKVLIGGSTALADSSGYSPHLHVNTGDTNSSGIAISAFTGGGQGYFKFFRSRNTTIGNNTVVQSGDSLGMLEWNGADGTAYVRGAYIAAYVDGTPGTNDMPTRLMFGTTADGASSITERMRITSAGNVGIGVSTVNTLLEVGGTVRASRTGTPAQFVDVYSTGGSGVIRASSGTPLELGVAALHLGIGTTGLVFIGGNGTVAGGYGASHLLQLSQTRGDGFGVFRGAADVNGFTHAFHKSRNTTPTSHTIVASGDGLGQSVFFGSDGVGWITAAIIRAEVDGTPGVNDMPGRLVFYTTPDGSATPTERMRINNAGLITGTGTSLGAWTSWTPTWTNLTVGNGTQTFYYCQVGKTVHYRGLLIMGSTSSVTGVVDIAPPVTMVSTVGSISPVGNALYKDASASAYYQGLLVAINTTTMRLQAFNAAGTYAAITDVNATVPMTWNGTDTDRIYISGTYEAA